MICYTLKCAAAHDFDSWFRSSDAYEDLRAARQIACPICGDSDVEKSLMAPSVRPARTVVATPQPPPAGALSKPGSAVEEAFAAMRKQVEENSDYVGLNFAAEARQMHDGTLPSRPIYGEAKPEEARQLIEDGVPVAPLPFMPKRKTN
jgi:hypothetical protein